MLGSLVIDASKGPEFEVTGSGGAAPARIVSPQWDVVQSEYARALELIGSEDLTATWSLSQGKEDQNFSHSLIAYLHSLGDDELSLIKGTPPVKFHGDLDDPVARENRIELEMDQHTQWLLTETPFIRKEFTKNLDTSSVEKYKESTEIKNHGQTANTLSKRFLNHLSKLLIFESISKRILEIKRRSETNSVLWGIPK